MKCPNMECLSRSGEVIRQSTTKRTLRTASMEFVHDGATPIVSFWCAHCFTFLGNNEAAVCASLGALEEPK